MLKRIKFDKFTAFERLDVELSPGINVFLGENATGKTHILKAAYAACDIAKTNGGFAQKITNVFYPSGKVIGRLVKRAKGSTTGRLEVVREIPGGKEISLRLRISNNTTKADRARVTGSPNAWMANPIETAYIPVKDMMANSRGFQSLYQERQIHFEEVYADILRKAFLPLLKGRPDGQRTRLLRNLQKAMDGKVVVKSEEFFLRNRQGELEFTLLAEGYRKLGLLWLLIQNGTLINGSVLFWDEPETNLNPALMRMVIEILMELQRLGVQILVTTHDYVILREFDLQSTPTDQVAYHSLHRESDSDRIAVSSTTQFLDISPNPIDDTFGSIIDREIERSMGELGK